ncbi:MAG: alpha/beta fold hydrolase [Chlorobium sp.]|jgi:carboxylesterase|uniref:alpha/beta hydrolase n=1 Tax=Chlorobium sp. TaxID=1095 RepID=UPI001E0CC2A5|nr:alpha/beta fold hydrolase [Chlorobium sp.]MBN1278752.1 alpha/beta fold hydrolase [Chlorobiaceae bacterium]MCF8215597.1 alpha/beta fold hydrolase [Chlorobium sp.]MCF8270349.1 alpha/beta fold hydrolase [Chlorobium sp.]MCF8286718.1 alpha/beta fold hydrolase [Chlorobium sp.]MCF8290240.1 alpha/beta fold hydrolase [Chlorobium sp.]
MPEKHQRRAIGVLIIHGFTATPESLSILEGPLKALGLPVKMPLLTGHGESSPEALRGVSCGQWIDDVSRALLEMASQADKIVVIGHSMGALLGLQLAAAYPGIVDSLVLAAPAIRLSSLLAPGRPLHFVSAPLSLVVRKWGLKPVFVGTDVLRCPGQYDWAPTDAILSLFRLIGMTVPLLADVYVPTLILHNRRETTVLAESADDLYNCIGTASNQKRIIWLDRSEHQIFCDCERERAMQAVVDFVSGRLHEAVSFEPDITITGNHQIPEAL